MDGRDGPPMPAVETRKHLPRVLVKPRRHEYVVNREVTDEAFCLLDGIRLERAVLSKERINWDDLMLGAGNGGAIVLREVWFDKIEWDARVDDVLVRQKRHGTNDHRVGGKHPSRRHGTTHVHQRAVQT